jgi:hypothetical protein
VVELTVELVEVRLPGASSSSAIWRSVGGSGVLRADRVQSTLRSSPFSYRPSFRARRRSVRGRRASRRAMPPARFGACSSSFPGPSPPIGSCPLQFRSWPPSPWDVRCRAAAVARAAIRRRTGGEGLAARGLGAALAEVLKEDSEAASGRGAAPFSRSAPRGSRPGAVEHGVDGPCPGARIRGCGRIAVAAPMRSPRHSRSTSAAVAALEREGGAARSLLGRPRRYGPRSAPLLWRARGAERDQRGA